MEPENLGCTSRPVTTFDHEENNTGRHPEAVAFRSSNMFGKALPREGVDIVAPPSEPKNIIDDVKEVADRARKAIGVAKDRTGDATDQFSAVAIDALEKSERIGSIIVDKAKTASWFYSTLYTSTFGLTFVNFRFRRMLLKRLFLVNEE